MWQGAEQEFATGSLPIELFDALGGKGVFVHKPDDGIPRAFLRNGGLCYIHSNLFEVCTPECRTPIEVVAYDKACEAYARLASWAYEERTGQRIHFYKTNIAKDPKGEVPYTTVGSHENYLVERRGYLDNLSLLIPYMILRQVFIGAGGYVNGSYMLSPRAIFPKKVFSETSIDYPILSTRDESHATEQYTRAHIVNSEGARSEYTTFLKHGVTSYVLRTIERGYLKSVPEIEEPIGTNKVIASNLEGDWAVPLKDGGKMGVVDYLNTYYLAPIERMFSDDAPTDDDKIALREIKWVLGKLDQGLVESLDTSIEWVIKRKLAENGLDAYNVEGGMGEGDAKTALLNQYMSVTDPLFDELVDEGQVKSILSEERVEKAFLEAPVDSRGVVRVALAREFRESIKSISWAYIKLLPKIRYQPIEFNELEGWTPEKVKELLDQVRSYI
jgi:proteasome accessory factor A